MDYLDKVQEFSDYVEAHVEDEMNFDHVINQLYFSKYHFYRVFKAVVGLPVQEYVKRRKLAKAAECLLHSKDSILTIAFQFGFQSQEVFTRNFKKIYGIPPGKYRKAPIPLRSIDRINVESIRLNMKLAKGKVKVNEKLEMINRLMLVGVVNQVSDPDPFSIIDRMTNFFTEAHLVPNNLNENVYRVCFDIDNTKEVATFQELIAIEVSDLSQIPDGMVGKVIDNVHVVTYTHQGKLFKDEDGKIIDTYHFIYQYRIPLLKATLTSDYIIEKYGKDFKGPYEDDAHMDISLSIIPESSNQNQ
ncbi:helix-turn-helix domain-containing protein [Ornithinibacillus sp. L9]|uniref:Helix-turn-helix domain-containing protein n=1 Tax=Ornithinibacillus caprae TaxID=2678566 RepID=A0A6N8FJQ8_9BACI|nr:AraC family transcriptional regulator [Ornithinibacillus caprae]MUK88207.1 helix-turn-helix domain-containing protein [Ornithinibacillus caprae]